MKILVLTSEFEPLTKIGGLGEVTASLARELKNLGCEIKIIIPYYKDIKSNIKKLELHPLSARIDLNVCIDWEPVKGKVYKINLKGLDCYMIDNKDLYHRNYIYNPFISDQNDDNIRFGFFALSSLQLIKHLDFIPDIIHCHDWQTAFVPLLLKCRKHLREDEYFKKSKIIFTIHNLSYQGIFNKNTLIKFGLPEYLFTSQNIEHNDKINLMKAGILFSDSITTVSETYSKEILNPEFGYGIDRILRNVNQDSKKLFGILNGIDNAQWNPVSDKHIYRNYSIENIGSKVKNKKKLLSEYNFIIEHDKPLIGMISKLTDQRGVDLLIESIPQILDLGFQIFILGTGDIKYHKKLYQIRNKYIGNISVMLKQDEIIARKIYSGADMILMPSRFEPCGLVQMIALRYGTIPVVRATGGLVDTVKDYNSHDRPTGFVFNQFSKVSLLDTLIRAVTVYEHKNEWNKLIKNAMAEDFSWKSSANRYMDLFNKTTNN
jgi:starch synthase